MESSIKLVTNWELSMSYDFNQFEVHRLEYTCVTQVRSAYLLNDTVDFLETNYPLFALSESR